MSCRNARYESAPATMPLTSPGAWLYWRIVAYTMDLPGWRAGTPVAGPAHGANLAAGLSPCKSLEGQTSIVAISAAVALLGKSLTATTQRAPRFRPFSGSAPEVARRPCLAALSPGESEALTAPSRLKAAWPPRVGTHLGRAARVR